MAASVLQDNPLRFTPVVGRRADDKKVARLPGKTTLRFTEVGQGKPPWRFVSVGAGMEALFVSVAVFVPAMLLQPPPPTLKYQTTILAAPVAPYVPPAPKKSWTRAPLPQPEPRLVEEVVKPPKPALVFEARLAPPVVRKRREAAMEAPQVGASFREEITVKTEQPRVLPPVQTGVLESRGSSAEPTLSPHPIEQVQTGGFGDPNGVPGTGRPDRAQNINPKGSFDLPPGPGLGNGTGGARGARGTVASAGFGNGVAVGGPERRSSPGEVRETSFGDAAPTAAAGSPAPRPAASAPVRTPVEILAKPNPKYTDEARRLRLEGEVKLRVVFAANGELQVLGVLQGLGHGLDEAAIAAARQIRFKPAREAGQAVDQSAIVTIEFKLAF
jgi:TonB family protein